MGQTASSHMLPLELLLLLLLLLLFVIECPLLLLC